MSAETQTTKMSSKQKWAFLTRSASLALDPSKWCVAVAAILVMWLGTSLLGLMFGIDETGHGGWPGNVNRGKNPYLSITTPEGRAELFTLGYWKGQTVNETPLHMEVFKRFYQPLIELVEFTPGTVRWWYDLFCVLLTVIVWGVAGGAICRMAAMEIARNEKVGLGEAFGFARSRWLSYVFAPGIPLIILALITLVFLVVCTLFIPLLGLLIPALGWILAIAAGFVMLLCVLVLIGWPLLIAGISVEGEDALGALARIGGFLNPNRIWSFFKYVVFSVIFGVLVLFVAVFLASAAVKLPRWAAGLTPFTASHPTGDPVGSMFVRAPKSYQWRELLLGQRHPGVVLYQTITSYIAKNPTANYPALLASLDDKNPKKLSELFKDVKIPEGILQEAPLSAEQTVTLKTYLEAFNTAAANEAPKLDQLFKPEAMYALIEAHMSGSQKVAASIAGFWLHLVFLLIIAFGYCLFWSAGTLIYFLLRHEDEARPMDEIYEDDSHDKFPWPQPLPAPLPTPAPASSTPPVPPPPSV